MSAPIVFIDIAGEDSQKLNKFYSEIFGWEITTDGQFKTPVVTPIPGAIRQDSSEKRIYIGVVNITEKLIEIEGKGGTVDKARFEVPGVVILGLFKDPAGNPMGLVEIENGSVKIPLLDQVQDANLEDLTKYKNEVSVLQLSIM